MQKSSGEVPEAWHRRRLTRAEITSAGFDLFEDERYDDKRNPSIADASDYIFDIREYDVPYHVRVAIDKGRESNEMEVSLLKYTRYPDWEVVYGGGQAWCYDSDLHRGANTTR